MPYNPVLVFKNQGERQNDDNDNIGRDDFLLAFQTEYRHDMMLKMVIKLSVWMTCMEQMCMISI